MPWITQIIFHIVKGSRSRINSSMSHNTIDVDIVHVLSSPISELRDSNAGIPSSGEILSIAETVVNIVVDSTANV